MQGKTALVDEPPADLTSPRSKLVYLYLATSGPTTVSDLQEALDLPKTTLLPVLNTLEEYGLLSRTGAAVTVN